MTSLSFHPFFSALFSFLSPSATMINNGIKEIISTDPHFDLINHFGMGFVKISILLFFFFPYLAIRSMLRRKEKNHLSSEGIQFSKKPSSPLPGED